MKNFLYIFIICVLAWSCAENSGKEDLRLVSKIDHVLIEPSDSYDFFIFLSEELQLPVVWDYSEYEDFMSGGVFCGNIKLESISTDKVDANSTICGIAFDPQLSTEETIIELDNRLIPHGVSIDMTSYIRTEINDILTGSWIFFCEYLMNKETVKKMFNLKQYELDKRNGGPLGIIEVLEINIYIESQDIIKNWEKLVPIEKITNTEFLYSESSPNIRFKVSNNNSIDSIKFKVQSIDKAKNYLISKNMLGSESSNLISTDPDKTYGVLFQFSGKDWIHSSLERILL